MFAELDAYNARAEFEAWLDDLEKIDHPCLDDFHKLAGAKGLAVQTTWNGIVRYFKVWHHDRELSPFPLFQSSEGFSVWQYLVAY